MRNLSFLRLFFLLLLFSPHLASAQWTKTNGLSGGTVSSFLHFGDTLLINSGRLHFSTNDGQSWTPLSNANPNIYNLATDGINLYGRGYGGSGSLISTSSDFGQTWSSILAPDTLLFYDFFILPGFIYGADYHGIYRSADQGAHWEFVTTQPISNITVDGQRIVGNTGNKVVESLDGGFTWNDLLQFSGYAISIVQDENYLFAFMQYANDGCWASSDYGHSWQHFTGTSFNQFYDFVWHDGTLIGLKGSELYKSDDLGDNWVQVSIPNLGHLAFSGISSGGSILIGGIDSGVLRSNDNGNSWFAANQGLIAATPTRLCITDQGLFAPAVKGIFHLQPDGVNWSDMHYDIPMLWYSDRFTTLLQAGDYLIAGVDDYNPWVSVDNGENWVQSVVPSMAPAGYFNPLGLVGNKIIATADNSDWITTYISDNNGLTFQPLTALTTQFNTSGRLFDLNAGQAYTLADNGNIYYSNNGDEWSLLSDNIPTDSLDSSWGYNRRLFIRGNSIWLFDGSYTTPKLAFSANLGQSWTIYDLKTAGFIWGISPFNDIISVGNYLLVAASNGIFRSNDGGLHWDAWEEGLVLNFANNLQLYDGYLWASIIGDGIWKRPISELGLQAATGTVFHDINSNGQQDSGEPGLPNIIVQSIGSNAYANTRADGTFTLLSSLAQEQIRVHPPAPYWTANPANQTVSLPSAGASFALTLDPAARDLSVALTNVAALRPGFETTYVLNWRNEVPVSATDGAIELTYSADELEFIHAIPAPTTQTTGLLKWQLGNLAPNATGLIQLLFKVPANVGLGTKICATATAGPLEDDLTPANNLRERCATVVGSYDPNDKQAEPATHLTPAAIAAREPVVYTIRFQNTGNFPANFVRISDTLSAYFDAATFRLLSSSHPCAWTLRHAGEVEFDFQNIQLPPITTDEPGSHGFVQYSVQARPDLPLGTPLLNTAHIFFDYNTPITTNTTETVISLLNPVHGPDVALKINIFPNPAANFVRLDLPADGLITVIDVLGRIMWQNQQGTGITEIDVRAWPSGAYRLRFNNGESQVERVLAVQR